MNHAAAATMACDGTFELVIGFCDGVREEVGHKGAAASKGTVSPVKRAIHLHNVYFLKAFSSLSRSAYLHLKNDYFFVLPQLYIFVIFAFLSTKKSLRITLLVVRDNSYLGSERISFLGILVLGHLRSFGGHFW